jgi:hypothetical protein
MSVYYRLSFIDFFTWITLGDGDLLFSLILIKAIVLEWGTTLAVCLYHQHFQSTHMTDGMIVMSLSASLQNKTSAAMDCLCQIVLNWKISCIVCAKKLWTENCPINLNSGVNFEVVLKWKGGRRICNKLNLFIQWSSIPLWGFVGGSSGLNMAYCAQLHCATLLWEK